MPSRNWFLCHSNDVIWCNLRSRKLKIKILKPLLICTSLNHAVIPVFTFITAITFGKHFNIEFGYVRPLQILSIKLQLSLLYYGFTEVNLIKIRKSWQNPGICFIQNNNFVSDPPKTVYVHLWLEVVTIIYN